MSHLFIDRIGADGAAIPLAGADAALREGEALHRDFRPDIKEDYVAYMQRMAAEGAGLTPAAGSPRYFFPKRLRSSSVPMLVMARLASGARSRSI